MVDEITKAVRRALYVARRNGCPVDDMTPRELAEEMADYDPVLEGVPVRRLTTVIRQVLRK